MTDDKRSDSAQLDDDLEDVNVEASLGAEQADRDIAKAVTGRNAMARKYVRRIRRRSHEATPADVIAMLERHYVTAISVAGAAVTIGTVALEIGISLIPGGGAAAAGGKAVAKRAGKTVAKEAAKQALKTAGKQVAIGAAQTGAHRVTALIPAGDAQLQFEITALFALALADIHGMELDKEQAHALVYGLSNGRVSQQQIATMATDLATTSDEVAKGTPASAGKRKDLSHWANTLADSLPGGQAQTLVRGVESGVLEGVRAGLSNKQQAAVDYGAGALVSGATKFVFGREVVEAARSAFAEAPAQFPAHLDVPSQAEMADDEPNRALEALEDAAKAFGAGVADRAAAVGAGVTNAAGAVSRPFRSVDLDGDGVPDEPQALSAVKGVASAAGALTRSLRKGDRDGDELRDEPKGFQGAK
ncbi:hypothetical protein, partial [Terrabacter terrae]|uniref:hypothetical protein n=1 Tax=Terrabacter terrae TaxID=318434 RepID=UPI0031D1081D